MDCEREIAILNERSENIKFQIGRIISHVESEQRVTGEISKRVGQVDLTLKNVQDQIARYERIIFNDGRGLLFEVDRLKRLQEQKKDSSRWNFTAIVAIISILGNIIQLIMTIL